MKQLLLSLIAIGMLACSGLIPTAPTPQPTSSIAEVGQKPAGQISTLTNSQRVAILVDMIDDITDDAIAATQTYGTVYNFDIHNADSTGSSVSGELKRPGHPRLYGVYVSYDLISGAMNYTSSSQLLEAMKTAVYYKAEVRLLGHSITCCLDKPAIAVTGRIEGDFN